jgi:D-3-phosphoglycerate dehydrogenase
VTARHRVVVTDGIAREGLGPLLTDERFEVIVERDSQSPAFRDALASAEGLLVRSTTRVNAALLAGAPALKVVGRAGVGVDNIDLDEATHRGVAVLNAPAGNTVSAAELTMALILAVVRRVAAADASVRGGEWTRGRFRGVELHGRTLGLVGAGRIGGEVARRARAFGMRVVVCDPFLPDERIRDMGAEPVELDDLFATAQVVSLHVPLTPDTRHLVDATRLGQMPAGSYLVNVSRGGVVDENAVAAALGEGHLAGAALDVFATEPLPAASPLREAPNLVLTPHLGASTDEAQERVAEEVARGVRAALVEGDLSRALNAPSVSSETLARLGALLDLGRRLGRMAAALAPGAIRGVEVGYGGSDGLRVLSRHVLVGLLEPIIGREGVNVVNAGVLARGRGIALSTRRPPEHRDYGEVLEVAVTTDGGRLELAGALLGDQHPRLVRLDDYDVNVEPAGTMLVLKNRDVPGVIGRVGTFLGGLGLNIAEYHQARRSEGGEALAAVVLDGPVHPGVRDRVLELPEVLDARLVDLSP